MTTNHGTSQRLADQTVLVLGGSSGIGLETARPAREAAGLAAAEGAAAE